ncbi:MAG: NifU family protein [Bacteroidia bacterium]
MENSIETGGPVQVFAESTPNPSVIKLITNRPLLSGYLLEVDRQHISDLSPLAKGLLEFPSLSSVMISNHFVSLTKASDEEWSELIPVFRDFMMHYLNAALPVVDATLWPEVAHRYTLDATFPASSSQGNEPQAREAGALESRIDEILRDYIQPAVEQDGGAIQLKSFDPVSGQVRVVLRGACNGCPSSSLTLKSGIENLLRRMVPEVREVVAD